MSRRAAPAAIPANRRLGIVLAALLAFFWQGFVAQTHAYLEHGGLAVVQSVGHDGTRLSGDTPSQLPEGCPVCRELAQTGSYLASAPVLLTQPAAFTHALLDLPPLQASRSHTSHSWQSRAPPLPRRA